MNTKCIQKKLEFQAYGKKQVVAANNGYEYLNHHDEWRKDPLVGIVCGKEENQ